MSISISSEAAQLLINTNTVDNIFITCQLSMTFSVFILDNTFIASVVCIFTSLIINQLLVIIKENLIAKLTLYIYGKAKTA